MSTTIPPGYALTDEQIDAAFMSAPLAGYALTDTASMTLAQFRDALRIVARAVERAVLAAAQQAAPAAPRTDGMPASAEERYLRRLLAARVGIPGAYYDDGEAQGCQHGIVIDFMREPAADIDAKLRALNVARAMSATPTPPGEAP
jgi:hypothetical protein